MMSRWTTCVGLSRPYHHANNAHLILDVSLLGFDFLSLFLDTYLRIPPFRIAQYVSRDNQLANS